MSTRWTGGDPAVFPLVAGVLTLALAAGLLAWLVAPVVAGWTVGLLLLGGWRGGAGPGRAAIAPAAEAEAARQALRTAAVEHLRARNRAGLCRGAGRDNVPGVHGP